MKNGFLVLFLLLVFCACKGDKTDVDLHNKWDRGKLISYVQYAEDGVTEAFRDEYEYDANGVLVHAKSYIDGRLSGSSYDFIYNGSKRTFMMDIYPPNNNTVSTLVEEHFLDNSYSSDKLTLRTNVMGKEVSREEYIYDSRGRENGYKIYYFNVLDSEYNNYTYKDDARSLIQNIYSEGELVGKKRVETVFLDEECCRSRIISRKEFQGESDTEYMREEYTYDAQDRENGYRSFYLGNVVSEQKNYVYDEINRVLTFDLYTYSQHIADDKNVVNKVKIVFY